MLIKIDKFLDEKIDEKNQINKELRKSIYKKKILKIIEAIYKSLKSGGKILLCGNGGSATDAQHLAAEYLVRLKPTINRRHFPVMNLAQDSQTITACGNDIGFENIFVRNLEAFYQKGDLLIVISTSGNSININKALRYAQRKKITSIGLLGNKGGKSKKLCDFSLVVPHTNTARIQECHIFLGHYIFEEVEKKLI